MKVEEQTVVHSTFVIERNYPVAPGRVFAAFAEPDRKRRWFVEGDNHAVEQYDMEFRAGGKECARIRFKESTPLKGMEYINNTTYQDIVTNRRIVLASTM